MITGIRKLLFIFVTTGYISVTLTAQTKIQVVSRSINRTFTYVEGTIIQVNGEKAQIKVRPSPTKQITVLITLVAKNPSLKDAETDVKYCNYTINESAGKIIIANTFDIKKGYKEISSNLSARIELEIPGDLSLTIRNIYGSIDLKDVQATWNITNDFGPLSFQNIKGTLTVNSKYGDISGFEINAPTNIDAKNSDMVLKDIHKILTVKDQYGTITLERIKAPVNVDCEMSAINISIADMMDCSCNFTDTKGNIQFPKEYQKYLSTKSGELNFKTDHGSVTLYIKTTYNNITIK